MNASQNGNGAGLGVESSRVNPMRVKKETQRIFVILTDQTRIKGLVHLPHSGRLSDLMNYQAADRPFLAMTDAVVRLPDGVRHKADFLTVNRNAVTTCFPAPDEAEDAEAPAEKATQSAPKAPARPAGSVAASVAAEVGAAVSSRQRASGQVVEDPRRALPGAPNVPVSSRRPGR